MLRKKPIVLEQYSCLRYGKKSAFMVMSKMPAKNGEKTVDFGQGYIPSRTRIPPNSPKSPKSRNSPNNNLIYQADRAPDFYISSLSRPR